MNLNLVELSLVEIDLVEMDLNRLAPRPLHPHAIPLKPRAPETAAGTHAHTCGFATANRALCLGRVNTTHACPEMADRMRDARASATADSHWLHATD